MATAPSKRKKPSRDKHMLKEQRKIESEVFDKPTLLILAKMLKKDVFTNLDFPISTGKEANVFSATTSSNEHLAVKIYKIETAPFFERMAYLEGDPRFKFRRKYAELDLVYTFARKEFKNLQICEQAGVHAPKPIYQIKNVLVMSFLGENGLPYPTMHTIKPRGENDLESILQDIKKMYKAGLVHADISEYNILAGDVAYIIDFGQGVVTRHPRADEFLERDVMNILKYFARAGYKRDFEETIRWIKS